MKRDFTYVDDVVAGIIKVIGKPALANDKWDGKSPDPSSSSAPYYVLNIGNNKSVELMQFIRELEKFLGKKATIQMKDMQAGDVRDTWANVDELINQFGYKPDTSITSGLKKFVAWYKAYYGEPETNRLKAV
jgi:UDP-glucuronate 4-epimerase